MNLPKDIEELIKAKVINQEVATQILDYYKSKSGASSNRLFVVFGILGALLAGLGLLLIIAHNWDELSRATKTLFAFLPLLIGQVICGIALAQKKDKVGWRESGAAFLYLSVGASIALVSQVYHIPGDLNSFLFTWSLLGFPILYVMDSSIASILYLLGITYFACENSYWSYPSFEPYLYWLLLLLALPHYVLLHKRKPQSNFTSIHHWILPLSLVITLGTITKNTEELMFVAYFSLFGLFYLIGETDFFKRQHLKNNGFKIIGSLGMIVLLLMLSYDWFWEDLKNTDLLLGEVLHTPEFIASASISLLAILLLYSNQRNKPLHQLHPLAPTFLLFIFTFIIGIKSSFAVLLINTIVFGVGVLTIRNGARQNHLGLLNFGLMILSALIVCRFFDTDLSFIFKGILFLSVGLGFFATNYWVLKKNKNL